jgi:hypothetical protein
VDCEHCEKVEDHDKVLYGNGHEGMISRVARMETKMTAVVWLCVTILGGIIGLAFKVIGG